MVVDFLAEDGRLDAIEHFMAIQEREFEGIQRRVVDQELKPPSAELPEYDDLSMWGQQDWGDYAENEGVDDESKI